MGLIYTHTGTIYINYPECNINEEKASLGQNEFMIGVVDSDIDETNYHKKKLLRA
ncbi:MAG: hypothetical protein HUJ51_05725 [Eggerthellaceae bacterium]|nr:hypothetical protein [Eggerthellaceae bacterium]